MGCRLSGSRPRCAKSEDFSRIISLRQRLVSRLQAEDGPSVEIGLHSGRDLAIAQATMKPDFRQLVVLELDVRKRTASPAHADESSAW